MCVCICVFTCICAYVFVCAFPQLSGTVYNVCCCPDAIWHRSATTPLHLWLADLLREGRDTLGQLRDEDITFYLILKAK